MSHCCIDVSTFTLAVLAWTLILQVVCSLQAAFGDVKANFQQLE